MYSSTVFPFYPQPFYCPSEMAKQKKEVERRTENGSGDSQPPRAAGSQNLLALSRFNLKPRTVDDVSETGLIDCDSDRLERNMYTVAVPLANLLAFASFLFGSPWLVYACARVCVCVCVCVRKIWSRHHGHEP